MQSTRENKEITKQIYAPDYVNFIVPTKGQFTYFDAPGTYTTFGMPALDLAAALKTFFLNFQNQSKKDFKNPSQEMTNKLESLKNTAKELQTMAEKYTNKTSYTNAEEAIKTLLATDHIPIILSALTATTQYATAARRVRAYDVEEYVGIHSHAIPQIREYCVKNDMMLAVAKLRQETVDLRYKTKNPKDPLFIFCNRLITGLDEKIIDANLKTLPINYEQFDLYETFANHIFELTCQLEKNPEKNKEQAQLIDDIIKLLCSIENDRHPDESQKILSDGLYSLIKNYAEFEIGISNEIDDIELDDQDNEKLQAILPLVAYLNSTHNPFARNGLLGKEITNSTHEKALTAYKNSESQEKTPYTNFKYAYKKPTHNIEFDDDQISQLLDGKQPGKQQTNVKGFFNQVFNVIAPGTNYKTSESAVRREQLMLPSPQEYNILMLEDVKNEEEVKSDIRPKK